jgi:NAD(P)-dependent dehydrogenase (short-subunit alcohol dehydrogenase family)
LGGLDILVNNAGVGIFANVADMDIRQWQEVIGTNLDGVFYCCHAAIPRMRERGGGYIINISSLAGKNSFVAGAAYCASKAGLNAFSESLMQEVRYDNIRVSYIMPGSVATGFGGPSARSASIGPARTEDRRRGRRRRGPRSAGDTRPHAVSRRDAARSHEELIDAGSRRRPLQPLERIGEARSARSTRARYSSADRRAC